MGGTFWAVVSGVWVMIASGPWETASYAHSWFDAFAFGVAVFAALKAVKA